MSSNAPSGREPEATRVAVVMQRTPLNSRWQPYAWKPIDVIPDPFGDGSMRCLRQDEADSRWLFPGFEVRLFSDEAEGYFLNIDSPQPGWFVMWRMEEVDGGEIAVPKHVTLSYHEASRLMDGGERVDSLPAPAEIVEQLAAFVRDFYKPEPKRKRRKPSFEGGEQVAQMASDEKDIHGR
ncbi:DUF3305 domain-containing protein [Noviherbaspirillum humi]|nr:DUF3305 domain-containing protein [Noviherbaspirillum humi]